MYLTNAEEQIMKLLWKLDKAFIRDLVAEFPDPKPATTTIITVLNRMIDKGFVNFRQCGNSREYFPLVKKSDYFSDHLRGLIKDFFSDSKSQFASFFAFETDMSNDELREIRDLIDKKLSSKSPKP
jgi:BlaI family transcriptional regulator, penicillinase repressor